MNIDSKTSGPSSKPFSLSRKNNMQKQWGNVSLKNFSINQKFTRGLTFWSRSSGYILYTEFGHFGGIFKKKILLVMNLLN